MKRLYECIDKLISYAKVNLNLAYKDEDYVRNSIFNILRLDAYKEKIEYESLEERPDDLLNELNTVCLELGLYEDYQSEYYLDQIMGFLSLMPSEIDLIFDSIYHENNPKEATEWFYNYCVKNDYVKKSKLDKNPRFECGDLIITINTSKPEFRDMKKAKTGNSTKGGYPKCTICHENEGFGGRNKKTLRTIDLKLDNQKWFWQFSPYGYFYQHGIAVNYEHTPMHIDKEAFSRLMDFVDMFPHWFIGSNAALPRIGGSVLGHDHYQGGGEILPMFKAKAKYTVKNINYPNSIVEILDWPGTVVRVVSKERSEIVNICEMIRDKWVNYNNPQIDIISFDEEGIHSAISPTVLKTERGYEMSIIFRNNITNEKYPDGIFHAHPEFHVIKKESIGLIEAQGLFILPGRLVKELGDIKDVIVNKNKLPNEYSEYQMIYNEIIKLCNNDFSSRNVDLAIKEELGSVCMRILHNTAVFKDDKLTLEFMEALNFYE